MAKLRFTVVGRDGSRTEAVAGPKQQIEFEHHFKTGLGKALSDVHIEHLYWLAWKGLQAEGVTVPVFSDWIDSIEDVEFTSDGGGDSRPLDLSPTV